MSALRRLPAPTARAIRPTLRSSPRRYAHDAHDAHGSGHLAAEENESFGKGFYFTLALIPTSWVLYKFNDEDSALRKYISSWDGLKEQWADRNKLHTDLIEQAAADRHLFLGQKGSRHVELKYPEMLNQGSPYNVPAGHYANLDKVIEHYKKQNAEEDERAMEAYRQREAAKK
ncbi:hypothetical protein K402DRAFT_390673 [Aulographum hederae CBS 113979]|uniref:NADH-ubiquinone oxidoreductase 17.8 kDa subunit n=1 Tax=Aulographum hederae CBS 113979 TaxID=1176131 RepID=A0A6G1H908_9PEZI|nr:hypothetical protein K402DRAFT_390673 [Aulographum hederae CBS 113979]